MRILLDENVDIRIKGELVAQGHDVTAIVEDYTRALTDQEVLYVAVREDRLLITNDRDFGELIVRNQSEHRGVIYLRLSTADFTSLLARITAVLATLKASQQDFLTVTDQRIRRRQVADEESEQN